MGDLTFFYNPKENENGIELLELDIETLKKDGSIVKSQLQAKINISPVNDKPLTQNISSHYDRRVDDE